MPAKFFEGQNLDTLMCCNGVSCLLLYNMKRKNKNSWRKGGRKGCKGFIEGGQTAGTDAISEALLSRDSRLPLDLTVRTMRRVASCSAEALGRIGAGFTPSWDLAPAWRST
jgi:hypothetical protein